MNKTNLEKALAQALPDCQIIVENQGNKYLITAQGAAFIGLNTLARHKLIYQHIQPFIADGTVHAVTIKALVPGENS